MINLAFAAEDYVNITLKEDFSTVKQRIFVLPAGMDEEGSIAGEALNLTKLE